MCRFVLFVLTFNPVIVLFRLVELQGQIKVTCKTSVYATRCNSFEILGGCVALAKVNFSLLVANNTPKKPTAIGH